MSCRRAETRISRSSSTETLWFRRMDSRILCAIHDVPSECSNRVWTAEGKTRYAIPSCLMPRKRWNSGVSMSSTSSGLISISPWTASRISFLLLILPEMIAYFLDMIISHTFFDIEIERVDSPDEIHLVKILAIDGRRFTYDLRPPLTE